MPLRVPTYPPAPGEARQGPEDAYYGSGVDFQVLEAVSSPTFTPDEISLPYWLTYHRVYGFAFTALAGGFVSGWASVDLRFFFGQDEIDRGKLTFPALDNVNLLSYGEPSPFTYTIPTQNIPSVADVLIHTQEYWKPYANLAAQPWTTVEPRTDFMWVHPSAFGTEPPLVQMAPLILHGPISKVRMENYQVSSAAHFTDTHFWVGFLSSTSPYK